MDPADVQLVVDELHGLEAVSEEMARIGGVGVGLSVLSVCVLWLVWTVGVFPLLSVRFRRHELEDDAFYLQTGVMTQTRYVVPYARMQSVSTVQGVIQRWCGVASLQVATAAFGVRSVRLDIEVAYDLSERILASIDGGRHVG
jgi:membrane protein YdbS with pleckstrin-like domain